MVQQTLLDDGFDRYDVFNRCQPKGWPAHDGIFDVVHREQLKRANSRARLRAQEMLRSFPTTDLLEQRLANKLYALEYSITERDMELRNGL